MMRTVIKVGGALLDTPGAFAWAIHELTRAPRDGSTLIVPGGGPFADTVRDIDRRIGLSDDAAHWAAVLAMDQYAHVLADRIPRATLVDDLDTPPPADRLPVLAPYAWLRSHDTLPHSWDVTADSIAAHVARGVNATRVVLLKLDTSTDPYFEMAIPPGCGVEPQIVLAGASIPW
jgi:5-(aminomethyl)-3-furanmethanol phosphate kinase